MIKADKTAVRIEGSNLDVAMQFLHIMDAMLEHHPEMIAAFITVRNEKIEEAIKSADIDEIRMSEAIFKGMTTIERMLDDEA